MAVSGFRKGLLAAASAHAMWGLLPLFWRLVSFISPLRILGCRIVFSFALTGAYLLITRNRRWLDLFRRRGLYTVACGILVSANWGLYVWAVNSGHTMDASLGYYINPLFSVLLGMIFLKERLGALQWTAFALALFGVALKTLSSGVFPIAAPLLALTFGVYGLLKKWNKAGAMEALGAESLVALPLGLALLVFPPSSLPQLAALGPARWLLLSGSGAATIVPLLAFSEGAKRLPLSLLGFLQFINPTILFFLGLFAFGEPFSLRDFWAFLAIWLAAALYCLSLRKGGGTGRGSRES